MFALFCSFWHSVYVHARGSLTHSTKVYKMELRCLFQHRAGICFGALRQTAKIRVRIRRNNGPIRPEYIKKYFDVLLIYSKLESALFFFIGF